MDELTSAALQALAERLRNSSLGEIEKLIQLHRNGECKNFDACMVHIDCISKCVPLYREDGSERTTLIKAVIDDPGEQTPRLVLADWLEEHGEPEEGARQRKVVSHTAEERDFESCAAPSPDEWGTAEHQTIGEIRRQGWQPRTAKGRGYGKNDERAFEKRVAKRRKKKGYR
jgi:uncharacterized protein (TIGR02996 family)